MTEKEAAKIAEILMGHKAEVEEAARHARPLFTGRLPAFLDPPAFDAWVRNWTDRQLHGHIADNARSGVALRAEDMRTLAPGLLAPGYFHINSGDVPDTVDAVEPFLRNLIARTPAPPDSSRKSGDAVAHATRHIGDLTTLAVRTWKLRDCSIDLYQAALRGDAPACRPLIERLDDPSLRFDAIEVVAILQIVWAAADVQRVAAYCWEKVQLQYVPFFLRPFARTRTAAEYIGLMKKMHHLRRRIFEHRKDAEDYGETRARITFKGGALTTIESVMEPLKDALSPENKQDIREREDWMTTESDRAVAAVESEIASYRDDKDSVKTSEQLSRFQVRHAGLSEIAALMVTSYRFAEREHAMREIIAHPKSAERLWDLTHRRYPAEIDETLLRRATAIHDSYRRHILRDIFFNDETVNDRSAGQYARTASNSAQAFLVKLSTATFDASGRMNRVGLTSPEYFSAHVLDLSQRVRSSEWRAKHLAIPA